MDENILQKMIQEKYVNVQKHPTEDLFIYNYTPKAQYDGGWNEVTLQCRGLIMDGKGNIIERPFRKFFNLSEHKGPLPEGNPTIWEKYDGSLGILYWIGDTPYIATRGSFTSEQAKKGTEILHRQIDRASRLRKDKTHLFEIVYPENRIVVDYEGKEFLVHLCSIDKGTGKSYRPDSDFHLASSYDIDWKNLPQRENKEGFVLEWPNGLRLKVKHDEYVRLHRLVTQVTARSLWDLLRHNKPFDELLDRVPDEFYDWVKTTKKSLENAYEEITTKAVQKFETVKKLETRKEQAEALKDYEYKHLVFKLLDGKEINNLVWDLLYPPHITPFKKDV